LRRKQFNRQVLQYLSAPYVAIARTQFAHGDQRYLT
jgi:hypothetical protein